MTESIMSESFDCKSCKESLYGKKYIQVDDVPHCVPCYDRLYGNTCHQCKELITHSARVSLCFENGFIVKLYKHLLVMLNALPHVL